MRVSACVQDVPAGYELSPGGCRAELLTAQICSSMNVLTVTAEPGNTRHNTGLDYDRNSNVKINDRKIFNHIKYTKK